MKHIGLFEGIGGFSLAARWMGWDTIAWCEWNEFGQKVLKHHFPKATPHGDITKTDFTIYNGQCDILTGGFPCQPYSSAGKRLGKEDERHLWPQMLRAIREIEPTFIVGENVRGLLNWNGGMVFDEVCADLENLGYEVTPCLIPAVGVNAPHKRERIWFVAYNPSNKRTATHSDIDGCIQKWRYDGSGQDVARSEVEGIRSTDTKDIIGCSANGSFKNEPTTGERISRKGNAQENKITNTRRICKLDKISNQQKENIGGAQLANNFGGALVSDNKSGVQLPINNGMEQNKINISSSDRIGLQNDLSRINTMDGSTTDTECIGHTRRTQTSGNDNAERIGRMDTDGGRNGDEIRSEVERCSGNTCNADAKNTNGIGQKRGMYPDKSQNAIRKQFSESNARHNEWGTWQNFPTQSPICTRNDGLPARLDGITFPKWRNESIKAGGNAIVPQVAYQIFKAIELCNSDHIK